MAQITASTVKELREKTGAGMMDCKKALTENAGDMEDAIDWLRTKGLSAAAKKSSRIAAEGLISALSTGTNGVLVEVNAETDFVSRNETFQNFVREITKITLEKGADMEAVLDADYPQTGRNVADQLTDAIATIGENMSLRRAVSLSVSQGVVASYIHAALVPGLGKIGVLVALESDGNPDKLSSLGKNLAMHVAAANPLFLSRSDVDAASLDRERTILTEQAKSEGKPEASAQKMVEGRLRKYYEDVCLLEQNYVIDTDYKVQQVVENFAKEIGTKVTLTAFAIYKLGEGLEKKQDDFATEVISVARR